MVGQYGSIILIHTQLTSTVAGPLGAQELVSPLQHLSRPCRDPSGDPEASNGEEMRRV